MVLRLKTSKGLDRLKRVSIMGKDNAVSGNTIPIHGRPVTRALASALRASSKLITSSEVAATTQNQGRVLRANTKRAALDEKKANAPKKRAILKDITNVTCENSYRSCFNAAKIQVVNYTMLLLKLTRSVFLLTIVGFRGAASFLFRWRISSR